MVMNVVVVDVAILAFNSDFHAATAAALLLQLLWLNNYALSVIVAAVVAALLSCGVDFFHKPIFVSIGYCGFCMAK